MAAKMLNLSNLRIKDLKDVATEYKIDLAGATSKADIKKKIFDSDPNEELFYEESETDKQLRLAELQYDIVKKNLEREKLQETRLDKDEKKKKKFDVKIQKYIEGEDIQIYIDTFERIADNSGWTNDDKISQLIGKLTGNAREAYVLMDRNDSRNYDKVKEAIFARYNLNNHACLLYTSPSPRDS